MNSSVTTPRTPGLPQRLAACARPEGRPVMYQQWQDLLFLHWEYAVATIQATLPDGLFVDTFDGKAYLGIVPFFMRNIRPRCLPAVPGISNFMEMNLRTYVHDRKGVPGVWFYSLEGNQRLAVEIARRLFHLPYEHAEMTSSRTAEGRIRYRSHPLRIAADRRGAVFHEPYALCRADVTAWDENLLPLDGFAPTGRAPDHILMSRGVDVSVFPLESVEVPMRVGTK